MFKIKNLKKIKKIFDIKIIRDRKKRTLRMNQFYYLSEMFDDLHKNTNKHDRTKIFMNDYDAFRSIESNDERIDSTNYQHKIDDFDNFVTNDKTIFTCDYFQT